MAESKKKSLSFTHWARPRVRTYEYNYEYGESYYRPLVRYISTSRALAASSSSTSSTSFSSSSSSYETRRQRLERRRRAASPPGALSFIERWAGEPFYGYGIGFRSKLSSERSSSSAYQSSFSSSEQSAKEYCRSIRARSVAAIQQSSSSSSSAAHSSSIDMRSQRARSVEIASRYRYASDDCLMRSTALDSALAATQDIMNTPSLTRKTLVLDNANVLHGKALNERYYVDYPKQHLVCPENCPLHNSPEWRRRFLIGNRFTDAASLGGFDVLYDPTVFTKSRRLLAKIGESRESEAEEVLIERSSESEASRRRIRAASYFA